MLFDFQFCSASAPQAASVSLTQNHTLIFSKELSGHMRICPSQKVADRGGTFPSLDCRSCIQHLLSACILAGLGVGDPGGQTGRAGGMLSLPSTAAAAILIPHSLWWVALAFLASIQQTARISALVIPARFPVCLWFLCGVNTETALCVCVCKTTQTFTKWFKTIFLCLKNEQMQLKFDRGGSEYCVCMEGG